MGSCSGIAMMTGHTRPSHARPSRVASKGTTNSAWLTLEAVVTFLTASQAAALLLEVGHADSRKGRCTMMFCLIVMNLVDGNSGVHNGGLDSLLLDDWLNGLRGIG